MKIFQFLMTLLISGALFSLSAASNVVPADSGEEKTVSRNVKYLSPKKAILTPGSLQSITSGKKTLTIEYRELHKTGQFPVVRIQGIPFKLTREGENLEFTWAAAGYDLKWKPQSIEVILTSSEPFNDKSFDLKAATTKHQVIYKGLIVETKRGDNTISMLEVTNMIAGSDGKMKQFSVKTWGDKSAASNFQIENNILAPEFHKQYEKGVNDEILYVFTTNERGEVVVYYR